MNAFSIGLSALTAGQTALDVIGQNVANASTPGYNQQNVSLVTQVAGTRGDGVSVAQIVQSTDSATQTAIVQSNSASSFFNTRVNDQQQAQSFIEPGTNDVGSQISALFNNVTQLTSNPSSVAQQGVLVSSASSLAQEFNSVASNLSQQQATLGSQVQQTVTQINNLTPQIASLNLQIEIGNAQGQNTNDLVDQQSGLVNELSNLTDVQVTTLSNGVVDVMGGGVPLVDGQMSGNLVATTGSNGNIGITETGSGLTMNPSGGSLGGLLTDVNQSLPSYQSQLNTLATTLMSQLDTVQATGLSSQGSFTSLTGTRGVSNTTATLSSLNLPIAPQSGTLYVSVENQSTGVETLNPITINPNTQSIQDVAAAITAGTSGEVQASVNGTTGTLQLQAQSGYTFDFAGNQPTVPPTENLNGTTTPQVTGVYSGASNDAYSFQVLGNGTVGTTSGLQLQVTNSENKVVATVNVGAGYTPGTAISIGDGLSVSLSAGTSNNGTFSTPVIANPDTSGILASLGVNSLFTGTTAGDMTVNPALAANPGLLSTSRSGQAGDTSNLQRMASIQNANILSNGTQTANDYFSQIVGSVGAEISSLTDQQTTQSNLAQNLQTESQSVTGVDINTQMVQMLSYQQMMEAASKYITTVNTTLQSVIDIIQ